MERILQRNFCVDLGNDKIESKNEGEKTFEIPGIIPEWVRIVPVSVFNLLATGNILTGLLDNYGFGK